MVVATRTIGTLKVGQQVWSYNPKTKQMEVEPILHVWIHQDNDLVDLTITQTKKQGKETKATSEVIHTNKKHPFLTVEKGFLPVGQIKLGMHVVEADGQLGVITGWKVVAGVQTMYNLEVQQDHTFVVGVGQWVVHNCTDNVAIDSSQQYNRDLLGRTPSSASTEAVLEKDPVCVYCGNPSEVADHEPSLQKRWTSGEYDNITQAQARADADNPERMVGACVSCNSSKGGRLLEGGVSDGWNWEASPANMRKTEGL